MSASVASLPTVSSFQMSQELAVGDFRQIMENTRFERKDQVASPEAVLVAIVDIMRAVKERGGVIYIVANQEDKTSSHFATDLMKNLEMGCVIVEDPVEIERFMNQDDALFLMDEKGGLAAGAIDAAKRKHTPTVSIGQSALQGEVRIVIGSSGHNGIIKMARLFLLHTLVDLWQNPHLRFADHLEELVDLVLSSQLSGPYAIDDFIDILKDLKGKVYVIGNGGSDQIAIDVKKELSEIGIFAKTLNTETGVMTAYSNDYGYPSIFSVQLERLLKPTDALIAISSSGSSKNITGAAQRALEMNVPVLTLSGFTEENPLRTLGKVNLFVEKKEYGLVEMAHFFLLLNVVRSLSLRLL